MIERLVYPTNPRRIPRELKFQFDQGETVERYVLVANRPILFIRGLGHRDISGLEWDIYRRKTEKNPDGSTGYVYDRTRRSKKK